MPTFEAQVLAQPQAIAELAERVGDFLESDGVDARTAHHVAMILEELLTNLGSHGGGPGEFAAVRVSIAPAHVDVEVVDRGAAFDPRSGPEPDLTASLDDRKIGGLGLFLMRKLATDLYYAREAGQNHTKFCVLRR